MVGLDKDNFESLINDLQKAIAETLEVGEVRIELAHAHEKGNETRDAPQELVIRVTIQAMDRTSMKSLLTTANDLAYLTKELTRSMKKKKIPDIVQIKKIMKPLVSQRKRPNFMIILTYDIINYFNEMTGFS